MLEETPEPPARPPRAPGNASRSLLKTALWFTSAAVHKRRVVLKDYADSAARPKKGRAAIDAPRRRAHREQPQPPRERDPEDGAPRHAREPRRRRRAGRRGVRLQPRAARVPGRGRQSCAGIDPKKTETRRARADAGRAGGWTPPATSAALDCSCEKRTFWGAFACPSLMFLPTSLRLASSHAARVSLDFAVPS